MQLSDAMTATPLRAKLSEHNEASCSPPLVTLFCRVPTDVTSFFRNNLLRKLLAAIEGCMNLHVLDAFLGKQHFSLATGKMARLKILRVAGIVPEFSSLRLLEQGHPPSGLWPAEPKVCLKTMLDHLIPDLTYV